MSLFGDRQLVELRIPSGKPGKEGADALKTLAAAANPDVLTLVTLPRLDAATQKAAWFTALTDGGVALRIDPVERAQLPNWVGQRLAQHGQRVAAGEEGRRALQFIAERVEGNLLAAHQEIQKLGLLYPQGALGFEQVQDAVLNVARYDVFKLNEAMLAGDVGRLARMLDGLQGEGEATGLVVEAVVEALRTLLRAKRGVAGGHALATLLRAHRVWPPREGAGGPAGGRGGRAAPRRPAVCPLDPLVQFAGKCRAPWRGPEETDHGYRPVHERPRPPCPPGFACDGAGLYRREEPRARSDCLRDRARRAGAQRGERPRCGARARQRARHSLHRPADTLRQGIEGDGRGLAAGRVVARPDRRDRQSEIPPERHPGRADARAA